MANLVTGQAARLPRHLLSVPDYKALPARALQVQVRALEQDFLISARTLLPWQDGGRLLQTRQWLALQFDSYLASDTEHYCLGRVHDVELAIGRLVHRKTIDCPPYAEVLLQGMQGAAIRHPEYHLGRDLCLFYNLFLDSEVIMDAHQSAGRVHSSESHQSLARGTIITCFNLMEAFVSGLGTSAILGDPQVDAVHYKALSDDSKPLRKRLATCVSILTNAPWPPDESTEPMHTLFAQLKPRRDAMVHCSPGPAPAKHGYVKEVLFHDATRDVVDRTVDATLETISLAWQAVHGRERPSWLPTRGPDARLPSANLQLAAPVPP